MPLLGQLTVLSSAGQLFCLSEYLMWPGVDSGHQHIISLCDSRSHINTRHPIVTMPRRQLITSSFGALLTAKRLKWLSTDWNVNLADGI